MKPSRTGVGFYLRVCTATSFRHIDCLFVCLRHAVSKRNLPSGDVFGRDDRAKVPRLAAYILRRGERGQRNGGTRAIQEQLEAARQSSTSALKGHRMSNPYPKL